MGGSESGVLPVHAGVPQRLVHRPLLFLLYLNDLPSLVVSGWFTVYADDTTILWLHRDSKQLENIIQRYLVLLKKWCDSNFLTFNINKTNILSFKCNFGVISLESIPISNFQTNKFLGLYIDNKLKFDLHVTNLNKKLSKSCYVIRMVSRELSREVAVSVSCSF